MAVVKRPAAAVHCQAQTNPTKKKKTVVVAKRTTPSTIKSAPAFANAADYKEDSCLGEGASGMVYTGHHRATVQTVAIKFADDRDLLREARFLEACDGNPHVVGFRCLIRDPCTHEIGLAMEFVSGHSLREFLYQRRRANAPPLPEATVRFFMRQLLTGAKGIHDRDIVHRDIKPENVLVTEEEGGEVLLKICDFGEAISSSDPPPHNLAGTLLYMAPEVLMGKPEHDALVDAWSIGCIMAELAGGGEKLRLLLNPEHPRLREMFPEETLSEEGFKVLTGLLTRNPDERLTTADALKLPWFAAATAD